ncbi:cytochrome c nitrite reductase subunit NrfD [Psychromonas ossibalaenae]|uniref:cytochrome c nitrite reductase subunit NrfD n=1 Tax=Psychromonas ossibalaenae TaxID=444922 RepID=UPI000372FCC1|nr:cytochrome c nitrite reductase subunit NrfD [Psychromonas ossibalaenae]
MNTFIEAFSGEAVVWDWIIAVYLFLAGMSAGMVMIAIYLKRKVIEGRAADNGIIKATAILAPFGIVVGLTILVFHLTKPLAFWKIMIYVNTTSIMSMGVILFNVYMAVLFVWLAVLFKDELLNILNKFVGDKLNFIGLIIDKIKPLENMLEVILAVLAVTLAAYTGFLLSALKTFPLLNNPVLPVLFVFSSLSSGAAASLMFGVLVFKQSMHCPSVKWVHGFERPVVMFELFLLLCFFSGLILGGGQKEAAAMAAIGAGFWAGWFWIGVVGLGMLLPLILNFVTSEQTRHTSSFLFMVTGLSLLGVLMLRTFILYAGQMTVV